MVCETCSVKCMRYLVQNVAFWNPRACLLAAKSTRSKFEFKRPILEREILQYCALAGVAHNSHDLRSRSVEIYYDLDVPGGLIV